MTDDEKFMQELFDATKAIDIACNGHDHGIVLLAIGIILSEQAAAYSKPEDYDSIINYDLKVIEKSFQENMAELSEARKSKGPNVLPFARPG
jgi:hypothetical protein